MSSEDKDMVFLIFEKNILSVPFAWNPWKRTTLHFSLVSVNIKLVIIKFIKLFTQVCRFCWAKIINEENGLCPACREVRFLVDKHSFVQQYNTEKPALYKPILESE